MSDFYYQKKSKARLKDYQKKLVFREFELK